MKLGHIPEGTNNSVKVNIVGNLTDMYCSMQETSWRLDQIMGGGEPDQKRMVDALLGRHGRFKVDSWAEERG